MSQHTLLVVDGNSILNRAFYGIRPLTTRDGLPTNAIFGFFNILKKHLDELQPDHLVCAFDRKEPTFRHKMYDEYKAGRHPMPEELCRQLPIAHAAAAALGFSVLSKAGYEADDILGTCAAMAEAEGARAYVLTGDRDSLQLISPLTTVLLAKNKEDVPYTPEAFRQEYGIDASQFVDVKALMGDSSDNIPGVAGIGEKTALKLIGEFGTLDGLYEGLEFSALSAGTKAKLAAGRESAYFSKELATICRTVPLECSLSDFRTDGYDKSALAELFTRLEFTSFFRKFGLNESDAAPSAEAFVYPAETEAEPDEIPEGPLSVSAENSDGGLVLHFAAGGKAWRISGDSLTPAFFARRPLYCHDFKRLLHSLGDLGAGAECRFDTMLAEYLLAPGSGKYPLLAPASRVLHVHAESFTSAEEAALVDALVPPLREEVEKAGMLPLLTEVEIPLSPVLADMESIGFRLDTAGLGKYAEELGRTAAALEQSIFMKAGGTFNINSPKQLSDVLFCRLGLPSGKKTQSGFSTDAETLEKLRPYHDIVDDILDYRTITKLKSTYGDALIPLVDRDSRIHTTFNQTGTATGRLSSADPNLQNIPVRGQLGRELRRFYTADGEGRTLLDADYSQIELRLLAELSGDENLTEAFLSGQDIHASTASRVFHVPMEQMTPEIRSRAKAVNFGIVYGIGDYSLSQDLKISRKQAAEYIRSYFDTYPKVEAYLNHSIEQARTTGYATTKYGRRRSLPELSAKNKMTQAFGERVAMNSPIQGTAADVIKIAMIRVHKALKDAGIDARLILQVHDELIIECAEACRDQAAAILKESMEHAAETTVPLSAEVSSGFTWYDAK